MSTNVLKKSEIKRCWHLVDAKDQILGRLSTQIATLIMGKNKPNFVPYLDNGDYVVVINASGVKVSGKKADQKKYYRHSGYPGGFREETFSKLKERKPAEIISQAVWGMIPKGKLGRVMFKKLHVFSNTDHPFKQHFQENK